ncbi:LLM class flavin-dependent oxidoreductase [Nocardia panacis]|uniref:LLM class flavin-dependent oxidoreductase n=1 Tax=Nocardia panacis TaxID=2340916 RepID=A0A3A4KI80_9NOCA|nr:LLM class flavin-dependent oxidoreductase [Nocardia panacis]RJO74095.1 LLM class flavin-dependent oxidoreductase [Nocardia panacis]
MTVLGAVSMPHLPPEHLAAAADAAEHSGVDELWVWEDCFWGGAIASAATILARTERIRVGIGVMPTPLRNVAVTAMELSVLLRAHPGRLVPGVGHGVQEWMGQIGARVESPLTLLREQLDALRGLLGGEKVSVDGRYVRLDGVSLVYPPTVPTQLIAAASGPKTLRLAGRYADGVTLTSSTSPEGVRAARTLIAEGVAKSGRTRPHRLIANIEAATGPDAAERLARAQATRPSHQPGAGVAGDAHAIADAVHRYVEAGADTVILQPTEDDPDLVGFIRFIGEQVRPLVS